MEESAVVFHDAQHGRQPQPGALSERFGGEEGVENLFQQFRGDAGAGVGHGNDDERAGLRLGMNLHARLVELDLFQADGEGAALRHGVAGVDAEVHQHLLDLRGVAEQDAGRFRGG